jgi:hypothetical protein
MSNFHDFMEHAMFPFPKSDEARSIDSTDVSKIEVRLLKAEWKAKHPVRNDTLVQKLCDTLQDILGDRILPADAKKHLFVAFSPKLQVSEYTGTRVYSEDDMEEVVVQERERDWGVVNNGVVDMVVITRKGNCVHKQGIQ